MAIPLSILGGAAIIGVGLYLGLSARSDVPPASPAVSQAPTTKESAQPAPENKSAPANGPAADTGSPAPSNVRPAAVSEADAAKVVMESFRKDVIEKCWKPHKGDEGIPAKLKFTYSGSFNPKGVEVARGISESRDGAWPAVGQCARSLPMGLQIPTPGTIVNVNVPFEVP